MAITSSRSVRGVQPDVTLITTGAEAHYALRVSTAASATVWFPGGEVAAAKIRQMDPGATVLDARLMGVPNYSEDAGMVSGEASLSAGSYDVVDVGGSATDFLAGRFANQQDLKGAVLALFRFDENSLPDDEHRFRTSLGIEKQDSDGKLTISFEGVHSLLSGTLFKRRTWKITQNFNPGDDLITVDTSDYPDGLPGFEHNDRYALHPNQIVGYLRLPTGEIIAYTPGSINNVTTDRGTLTSIPVLERALFGTAEEKIEISDGTEFDSLPDAAEFWYLQETPSSMLMGVIAGETVDGRVLPAPWTLGLGRERLDELSLARTVIGLDDELMRFNDLPEEDAKSFVETKIVGPMFAALLEDPFGRFELRRRQLKATGSAPVARITRSDIVQGQDLVLKEHTAELSNPLIVRRGWNPVTQAPAIADIVYDEPTLRTYGALNERVIDLPGWSSDVGSTPTSELRLSFYRDLYQSKTKAIPLDMLSHMDWIRVGDTVEVDLPMVRDTTTGESAALPLLDSFVVVAKESTADEGVRLALFTTLGRAQQQLSTRQYRHLDLAEYARLAPTLLSSVVTPTRRGDTDVFAGEHVVEPDKFYRITDKAELATDFKLRPSRRCHFLGIVHQEQLHVLSNDAAIDCSEMSVYQGVTSPEGNPGYIGEAFGSGDIIGTDRLLGTADDNPTQWRNVRIDSTPSRVRGRRPVLTSFSGWPLTHFEGQLGNLPREIGGSGGRGTGVAEFRNGSGTVSGGENTRVRGGDGGASALFIGPVLTRSQNAVFCNVSGGAQRLGGLTRGLRAGPSGPGMAGIAAFLTDGDNAQPVLSSQSVKAFSGASPTLPGDTRQVQAPSTVKRLNSSTASFDPPLMSYYGVAASYNRWQAHSATMQIPSDATRAERPLNAFDALAEAEAGFDGKTTLHVMEGSGPTPTFPSLADANDMAAFRTELDNVALPYDEVLIWQLRSDGGWERVVFPDIVAEFRIEQYRARGTTVLFVTPNRPTFGTYRVGFDTWYDRESRRHYVLGATAAEDVLISVDTFSDYTGLDILADPTFADYLSGLDTLHFGRSVNEPLRTGNPIEVDTGSGEVDGQTSDAFHLQRMVAPDYDEAGAALWAHSGSQLVSSNAGGSGDARAFYGRDEGMNSDTEDRQVWVYASGNGTLKIQGSGDAGPNGDSSRQAFLSVSGSTLAWRRASGLFPAYASQMQVRTQSSGITVAAVILLDEASGSIPAGPAGFNGGTGGSAADGDLPRPYWPVTTAPNRLEPLGRDDSRGPIQVGNFGVEGSPGIRIDYSGEGQTNCVRERFPFKAHAGRQYRFEVLAKNSVSSGFDDPGKMGVALQFDGYDQNGARVMTTDALGVGAGREGWMSKNHNEFKLLTLIVDIPDSVTSLAWGSIVIIVTGNASGYCDISEHTAVQLPYRTIEVREDSIDRYNVFNSTDRAAYTQDFDVSGKMGMLITSEFSAKFSVDDVDPGNAVNSGGSGDQYPGIINEIQLRYVDSDGNTIGYSDDLDTNLLDYYKSTFWPLPQVTFAYSGITQLLNVVTEQQRQVTDAKSLIAQHDFDRIRFRITTYDRTQASPTQNMFVRQYRATVQYGENFSEGYAS